MHLNLGPQHGGRGLRDGYHSFEFEVEVEAAAPLRKVNPHLESHRADLDGGGGGVVLLGVDGHDDLGGSLVPVIAAFNFVLAGVLQLEVICSFASTARTQ